MIIDDLIDHIWIDYNWCDILFFLSNVFIYFTERNKFSSSLNIDMVHYGVDLNLLLWLYHRIILH